MSSFKKNSPPVSPTGQQDGECFPERTDPGADTEPDAVADTLQDQLAGEGERSQDDGASAISAGGKSAQRANPEPVSQEPVTPAASERGKLPGQHDIFSIPEALAMTDKMRSQLASDSGSSRPALAQLPPKREEPEGLAAPEPLTSKPLDVSRIVSSLDYNKGRTHASPLSRGRVTTGGREPEKRKFREGHLSRLVERGVVHPLPVRLVVTSILLLLNKVFLLSLIIAFCVLIATGNSRLVPELLPFAFVFIPFGTAFLLIANRARCRLCSCPLFFVRLCRKHRAAHYLPLVGVACSTAFHLLFFKWMRCMYCGTAIRLRRRSSPGSSPQAAVAADDEY
ncbi:MAG: hypothetical protein VCA55_05415 [Verrucomicrobiales bacterium]|jgi:hypothetical protein